MNELVVIGGGSGILDYILPVAQKEIKKADYVFASKRFLDLFNDKEIFPIGKIDDTLAKIEECLKLGTVAVVVSGDPLMYSLCKTIQIKLPYISLRIIPSVGSLQMAGAKFGFTMEKSKILSVHGRQVNRGTIAMSVYENETVFLLCSAEQNPDFISKILIDYGMDNVMMYIGANLSYEDEVLDKGKAHEIQGRIYPSLCVVIVHNPNPKVCVRKQFLKDDEFIRNKSPMTKEEIRAVIMLKLELQPDSIVWDLGAGTGSISVECARQCPFGNVYAVEKKALALDVIAKNKEKFSCDNLIIKDGDICDIIKDLPSPDIVFVGGSSGELPVVFDYLGKLNKKIRVVMTAVTMETQHQGYENMKNLADFDMVQLGVSRSKQIGGYTIFEGNNPVIILSANIEKEQKV